jgi:hypothetical protein
MPAMHDNNCNCFCREDYEVNYFVSGKGRLEAYDPDCRFADDFASFNGVERFRNNVSNLGGLT